MALRHKFARRHNNTILYSMAHSNNVLHIHSLSTTICYLVFDNLITKIYHNIALEATRRRHRCNTLYDDDIVFLFIRVSAHNIRM